MNVINTGQGVGGILNNFRGLVKDSEKITFVGTPGFCTPFAELIGFVVRNKQLAFVPNLDFESARTLSMTKQGMQLGDSTDPSADTVVLLGGLAMPKIGVKAEEANGLVGKVLEGKENGKIIGVCFQSMFMQQKWEEVISFDYIINADLNIKVMEV